MSLRSSRLLQAVAAFACASLFTPLFAQSPVSFPEARTFPESISSTPDGTLYIASTGKSGVYRAAPGATTASLWIPTGANGLERVLGVLADPRAKTLWVCSTKVGDGAPSALKSFDLASGAPKASYDFIEPDGTCNDIAVATNGDAYVSETKHGSILRLKRGAKSFEMWIKDPQLAGVDGIAFGDRDTLVVNTVSTGHLFRIRIKKDGSADSIEPLTPSSPLSHPDGMRALGNNRFLMVEQAGRLDLVTVSGSNAEIKVLKDGFTLPTGVTVTGKTAWVIEGRLALMNDPSRDPGVFQALPVPLP